MMSRKYFEVFESRGFECSDPIFVLESNGLDRFAYLMIELFLDGDADVDGNENEGNVSASTLKDVTVETPASSVSMDASKQFE